MYRTIYLLFDTKIRRDNNRVSMIGILESTQSVRKIVSTKKIKIMTPIIKESHLKRFIICEVLTPTTVNNVDIKGDENKVDLDPPENYVPRS